MTEGSTVFFCKGLVEVFLGGFMNSDFPTGKNGPSVLPETIGLKNVCCPPVNVSDVGCPESVLFDT